MIIIAAGPLAVLFWPGVVLVIVGCCVIARQREVKTPIGPRVALLVIPIGAPLILGAFGAARSSPTSGPVPEWGDQALIAALAAQILVGLTIVWTWHGARMRSTLLALGAGVIHFAMSASAYLCMSGEF